MASARSPGARLTSLLTNTWWAPRRNLLARCLTPLAWLYDALRRVALTRAGAGRPWQAPCPVIVVGNLIVGGAGKSPTVIALVRELRALGYMPGVVSRGYRRRTPGVRQVDADSAVSQVGDEPLMIRRATAAPVVVGERRVDAARALLQAYPQVDVLVSDDGLQHAALARDVELWVFDERGVGNGALLPAGPLRQPLPAAVPPNALVLYNAAQPSTPLPGSLATRGLAGALAWPEWRTGAAMRSATLQALRGRRIVAIAGIAAPARFFAMLRGAGLDIEELPLADHATYERAPWPPLAAEVICTEKDAVKLDARMIGATRVWVVGLDFRLPPELLAAVRQRIGPPRSP